MVPSHYLNQCRLIIDGVLWHIPKTWNFVGSTQEINSCKVLEKNTLATLLPHLPEANELMTSNDAVYFLCRRPSSSRWRRMLGGRGRRRSVCGGGRWKRNARWRQNVTGYSTSLTWSKRRSGTKRSVHSQPRKIRLWALRQDTDVVWPAQENPLWR